MKIKRFANITTLILLTYLLGKILEFMTYDDYTSARTKIHDMYCENQNIDTLFLGSSHTYASFDTTYLDDALGQNTYNLGTGDQQLDGSLLLLKEVQKTNRLQNVYLDVYYRIALDSPYKERTGSELGYCYTVSDNVKWSLDKIKYLLDISSSNDYIMNFVPARRRWDKLFNPSYIRNNVKIKTSYEYTNYICPATGLLGNGVYGGKGYIAIQDAALPTIRKGYASKIDSLTQISPDWINSLQAIIKYCKQNNIEITLVTTPMPEFLLAQSENYDEYINMVSEIAKSHEIEYWDFNLCKEEYLKLETSDYYDMTHLRYTGTEKFDVLFADMVNRKVTAEEIFYPTYQEKLNAEEAQIYGIVIETDEANGNWSFTPITNIDKTDISYTVSYIDDNGNNQIIQNLDSNLAIDNYYQGTYELKCYYQDKFLGEFILNQ